MFRVSMITPITIDYTQSFEEMIKGEWDRSGQICSEVQPLSGKGVIAFSVGLFKIPPYCTLIDDLPSIIKKQGFLPASVEHLVQFSKKYPAPHFTPTHGVFSLLPSPKEFLHFSDIWDWKIVGENDWSQTLYKWSFEKRYFTSGASYDRFWHTKDYFLVIIP